MNINDLTFGQRIVVLRKQRGLLQKELAEKIGLSPTALNYYEKDKREPNVAMIKKLSNALGVTGNELLGLPSPTKKTPSTTEGEGYTDKEIYLIKLFQSAAPEIQAAAYAMLEAAEKARFVRDSSEEDE